MSAACRRMSSGLCDQTSTCSSHASRSGSCSHHLCCIMKSRPSWWVASSYDLHGAPLIYNDLNYAKSDRGIFSFIAAICRDVLCLNRQTAIKPTSLVMTTHQRLRCVLKCTFILNSLCFCAFNECITCLTSSLSTYYSL